MSQTRWLRRITAGGLTGMLLLASACGGSDPPAGNGAGGCDQAQDLLVAFATPTGGSYDAGGAAFGEFLEENAPGCFNYRMSTGGELGDELDIQQAIQMGAIQAGVGAFTIESFLAEYALFTTPFVFSDRDHAYAVVDGDIGDEMRDLMAERAGFQILGYFTAGDRHILSTNSLTEASDLGGLDIRVPPSPLQVNVWRAVGVNPIDLPFGDMYTALQTGTIEAVEMDPANIVGLRLYEVAQHLLLTDHLTGTYAFLMDSAYYDALSPELQQVVDEAGLVAQEANRSEDEKQLEAALTELEQEHGVTIVPFDNAVLREQVRSVYGQFPDSLPPDLLERVLTEDF